MTSLLSISNCSVHLPIKDGTENFLYINISYIRTQTINIYDACICNYYILSPCWRYRINNNFCFTQVDPLLGYYPCTRPSKKVPL